MGREHPDFDIAEAMCELLEEFPFGPFTGRLSVRGTFAGRDPESIDRIGEDTS